MTNMLITCKYIDNYIYSTIKENINTILNISSKDDKKEIVLTMGAGDIDVLADKLEDLIVQNY